MAPAYTPAGPRTGREKHIKVCVRVRPFSKTEVVRGGGKSAWTWHDNTIYQQIFPAQPPQRRYTQEQKNASTSSGESSRGDGSSSSYPSSYSFDQLYPPQAKNKDVYDRSIKDMIHAAVEGYHTSVFIYGQTGTGKTYTMQGDKQEPGIIQLAVRDIFDHVQTHPDMEFLLRFSYLEIYNERIYDLLAAGASNEIKIYDIERDDADEDNNANLGCKEIFIKGLREEIVLSVDHVLSLVEVGNFHRHVAITDTNDQSSRSHTIFRLTIESQRNSGSDLNNEEAPPVRSATLNLIDLAGSESVRLQSLENQHVEEGKYINRSLLTLGHIIWKLSRDKSKSSSSSSMPLPYKNSKLTRILQPSLGGKAQIAVICTIAPSVACIAETHNTLKFATRARRVKHRASINEYAGKTALLNKYRGRIRELEKQMEELQRRKASASFSSGGATQAIVNLSTIEERQMEIQFAINNINRVILNSSKRRESLDSRPSERNALSSASMETASIEGDRETKPASPKVRILTPEIEDPPEQVSTSRPNSPQDNGNKTDEAESVSDISPPSIASMSQQVYRSKMSDRQASSTSSTQFHHSNPGNQHQHFYERPSLIAVLKTKYLDALWKMEEATRRKSVPSSVETFQPINLASFASGDMESQKELLREFVRGLEVAETEQSWRASRIQELEDENRRLQMILQSREEELLALKNINLEDETF